MKAHFAPCEGCGRHIRVSETACPFCDAATSPAFRARAAPRPPARRLSRAALFAFGAASAATIACSSSSDTTGGSTDGGGDAVDTGGNQPAYGLPIDSGLDTGVKDAVDDTTPDDTGTPVADAAYGGPPIDSALDSSSPDGSGTDGAAPAYGLPPDTGAP